MGSSGGSSSPKESKETRALTAQQTAMLSDIQATVGQLDPYTFGLLGFNYTPTGNARSASVSDPKVIYSNMDDYASNPRAALTQLYYNSTNSGYNAPQAGFTLTPMTEEEKYAQLTGMDRNLYDLGTLQYQRLLDAYNGNLGVSPSLEADLENQYKILAETMAQKLGPNWMQSTPGIQAMKAWTEQANLVREEARRSMISEGQGLLLENLGYQQAATQQKLSNYVNTPAARYSATLESGNSLLSNLTARDQYYNSYKANQANQPSAAAAGISGALGGAASGAMLGSAVPGIGTAVGALGGAIIGGVGGLLSR